MSSSTSEQKPRAPRNRTVVLTDEDRERLRAVLLSHSEAASSLSTPHAMILGDFAPCVGTLPDCIVDLLFLDPPYNLNKAFNSVTFSRRPENEYSTWLDGVVRPLLRLLKPTATVYICGDWRSSHSIYEVASRYFKIQNRITWEREKGRGAKSNWKNACEDIWFCTTSDDFYFDVESVKVRRRVIAPYTNGDGTPKDWQQTSDGGLRDTHPSNLWTDISIPFWSMPENTDHPTQKSEKLLAKLLLASTRPGDLVFDPFAGSGTSAVVSKKLGRRCIAIEIDEEYCLLGLRRLELASLDPSIQGYAGGVFWERNTLALQRVNGSNGRVAATVRPETPLFE